MSVNPFIFANASFGVTANVEIIETIAKSGLIDLKKKMHLPYMTQQDNDVNLEEYFQAIAAIRWDYEKKGQATDLYHFNNRSQWTDISSKIKAIKLGSDLEEEVEYLEKDEAFDIDKQEERDLISLSDGNYDLNDMCEYVPQILGDVEFSA